jgi:hypothetical protein
MLSTLELLRRETYEGVVFPPWYLDVLTQTSDFVLRADCYRERNNMIVIKSASLTDLAQWE